MLFQNVKRIRCYLYMHAFGSIQRLDIYFLNYIFFYSRNIGFKKNKKKTWSKKYFKRVNLILINIMFLNKCSFCKMLITGFNYIRII